MSVHDESLQGAAALAAAAEWRLLALLFERPRAGWSHEVESLGREIGSTDLRHAVAAAREAREADYLATCGPGGCVSPREVAYRGREDLGHIVADIAAFHAAFAFRPRAEDPLDHVAVEAGLVGYLHLKESYARTQGDVGAAETCALAVQRFLESHLRFLAEPFTERLESAGAPDHLVLAARALVRRTGPAPEDSRRAGSDDARDDFECDGCELPRREPAPGIGGSRRVAGR